MAGDFNRNIYKDNTSDYIINFTNPFTLKHHVDITSNLKYTCCSMSGYAYNRVFDYVIDSNENIKEKILGNSQKNYKIPSSDHVLIIVKL
jgi:hypothetical protein